MIDRFGDLEFVDAPDHLVDRAEAQFGHELPRFLRDEEEIVHDVFGLAVEFLAQLRILRGNADRAGVQMALAHHDAAFDDQRRRREAVFLRAQQRGDDHVAAGLQLPVGFDADAAAQIVEYERLVRLRQTQLPGDARILDGRQRRRARPAGIAADEDFVRMGLGDARRHGTHADFGDELHGDPGVRIGVLQVEDQLREVFDRIDVVVRRRRDQLHARGGIAELRDVLIDLVPRQLPALARFRALRHLDLQLARVDEIVRGHAEARRRHLLDVAVLGIAVRQRNEPLGIFAAFAGVALAAEPVHRDREGFVRFLADRAERHGPGVEPLDDLARRLDLFDRNRGRRELEVEQAAQIRPALALVVDELREFGIGLGVVRPAGVLQLIDGLRIPVMVFALDAVVDLAAEVELADRRRFVRHAMPPERLLADLADPDAFHARGRAGEVAVDELVIESDGLEDLRAAVRLHGRDAHLGEDLEQPLVDRLDEFAFRRLRVEALRQIVVAFHVHERFEHEIGIDRAGAVADQAGEMMHVPRFAGLQDQADFGSGAFAHEVMVDRRNAEQARDRRPFLVDAAVAEDQELVALFDRLRSLPAHVVDRGAEPVRPFGHAEEHAQRLALEIRVGDPADLLQVGVRQNRLLHLDAAAGFRRLLHQVGLRSDVRHQRHDELLADRIDRRIRHLREELLEILEEQLRPVRQHGERRIGAHRRHRLFAGHDHRRDDHLELFDRVAERLLPLADRRMVRLRDVQRFRQLVERDAVLRDPAAVGLATDDVGLDLFVVDDAALHRIDEEHAARLEPALQADVLGVRGQHAGFRREHHDAVRRHLIAAGTQPVPVQCRADHPAVGEADGGGAVPRFHHGGVILIEPAAIQIHLRIGHPGFRNQHHHRVRQRAAAQKEELEGVVEAGRVALIFGHDREEFLHVLPEQFRMEAPLAGFHPIDVALQRVDFTVVADVAIGVGQRPGRKRIGAEARVHQRQRAHHAGVGQVLVIGRHLVRKQQALVDDRVGRQARDVEVFTPLNRRFLDGLFDPFPDDVELPFELGFVQDVARNEDLPHEGLGLAGLHPDRIALDRHVPPAEQARAFLLDDRGEELLALLTRRLVRGKEQLPDPVLAGARKRDARVARGPLQKLVGNLKKNPGAVAGAGVAPLRTPVGQVFEYLKALTDDVMRFLAFDVDDKADAARVFLVSRVVEPLLRWKPWEFHHAYLVKKAGLFLLDRGPAERDQERGLPLLSRRYPFQIRGSD